MSAQLEITNSPAIPGIHFRGFEGEIDYPKMINIIKATKAVDRDESVETVDDLRLQYKNLNNCDPLTDMLFVEVKGETIAYSRVFWYEDAKTKDLIYYHFFKLVPEWRDKGIEEAILAWDTTRLTQIAETHSHEVNQYYFTECLDFQESWVNLYENLGYSQIRFTILMKRSLLDIPNAELPEGIEIRPVLPEHYRKAWDATTEAFRDHWNFSEPTEADYRSYVDSRWFQPKIWQVAWDGDEIVGMVQNFIDDLENKQNNRKRGWTETISVRRQWRKKGIAKALIVKSMQMHKEMGMEEVALGVDTLNPNGALSLYSDLGYKEYQKFITFRKPVYSDKP